MVSLKIKDLWHSRVKYIGVVATRGGKVERSPTHPLHLLRICVAR